MANLRMTVNGKDVTGDVDARTLLVEFLRDHLRLTGAHVGCDTTQCGCCTPGMIMSALDLLGRNPRPREADIRHHLAGNLCRCTGYHNIVRAVQVAAEAMAGRC